MYNTNLPLRFRCRLDRPELRFMEHSEVILKCLCLQTNQINAIISCKITFDAQNKFHVFHEYDTVLVKLGLLRQII